jgi:selT/selW/selH-like putative selenoprotein
VSLAAELLTGWAPLLASVDIRAGSKGRFEVVLDGDLVFSKAASRRFPEAGELAKTVESRLGPAPAWRSSKH